MKKYAFVFAVILLPFLLATSFDDRENLSYPVFRIDVPQITVPNTQTTVETSSTMNCNGVVGQIAVTINDNTGNRTATVSILDEDDVPLWSEAGIAENATTTFQYWTLSGTDLPLAVFMSGNFTVTVLPSGDPGSSGMTADVVLWGK